MPDSQAQGLFAVASAAASAAACVVCEAVCAVSVEVFLAVVQQAETSAKTYTRTIPALTNLQQQQQRQVKASGWTDTGLDMGVQAEHMAPLPTTRSLASRLWLET